MVTTDGTAVVVCDAGPLIHLDELGCLDILFDFHKVAIPRTVADEIAQYRSIDMTSAGVFIIPDPPGDMYIHDIRRIFCLHKGETAALTLARAVKASLFLTDDPAARLAAQQFNLAVHGTIGILLRAVRRGLRKPSDMKKIIESIPVESSLISLYSGRRPVAAETYSQGLRCLQCMAPQNSPLYYTRHFPPYL